MNELIGVFVGFWGTHSTAYVAATGFPQPRAYASEPPHTSLQDMETIAIQTFYRNRCHASSNRCLTSSNKKLLAMASKLIAMASKLIAMASNSKIRRSFWAVESCASVELLHL